MFYLVVILVFSESIKREFSDTIKGEFSDSIKKGLNLSIPVRWKLILGGVHIGFNKSLKVYPSEHNLTTRNFA